MTEFGQVYLTGEICDLRPLEVLDTVPLFEISRDDSIWKYLSMYPKTIDEMKSFVKMGIDARNNKTAIPFIIYSKAKNKIYGTSRILDLLELHKTAEIGLTWLSPQTWGTGVNTEAHYLMLKYCFEDLNLRRVQFKIDVNNIRSYKSVEKFGATQEGLLRNFRNYLNGTYNNTYIYSIIDQDWEVSKTLFKKQMRMNVKLEKFFACGFLYNPKTNSVLLHQRDGNTTYNPFGWAFFGGTNEGKESEVECFKRELMEEVGLDVPLNKIVYLDDYLNTEFNTHRYIYYVESDVKKEDLKLGEGLGFDWVPIDKLFEFNLTEKTKRDLKTFITKVHQ